MDQCVVQERLEKACWPQKRSSSGWARERSCVASAHTVQLAARALQVLIHGVLGCILLTVVSLAVWGSQR